MPPVFVFLLILGAVGLWFALAFLYKPFGKLLNRIWRDSVDSINDEEEEKEEDVKQ